MAALPATRRAPAGQRRVDGGLAGASRTAAILALYGAWAAVERRARRERVAVHRSRCPLVYLAVPLVFVSLWFAIAWWFRAERPDERAARVRPARCGCSGTSSSRSPATRRE